jgi:hypothetical protein
MVNYNLGKIYKIVCNETGKVYIGSTCEPSLAKRLTKHVAHYKRYLGGKGDYITSYDVLENGNYEIILLESCPCNNKDELRAKEKEHILKNDCVNRIKNVVQTPEEKLKQMKEWYDNNKEYRLQHMKKYNKIYYDNNKEKWRELYLNKKMKTI